VTVALDGAPVGCPLGWVGALDVTWGPRRTRLDSLEVGQRITAEVIAVDLDEERVQLSLAATEHAELWGFLKRLRPGEVLSGTVASIESFGVFVALDDGPGHPIHPGVGFITHPDLSWRHFDDPRDVVRVGERVTCEYLYFDTTNGEARLSLRATSPDPFQAFADGTAPGDTLRGCVTKVVPFGYFVRVVDGVEGLVPLQDPVAVVGEELGVVVTELDRERRRLLLRATPASP
jgi:small subunit ribosomal protein S1